MLKNAVRSALRKAGVEVVARKPRNYPRLRRPLLIDEEAIDLVLDIGANIGQWASEIRTAGYRGRIVSFEPGSNAFAQLERAATDDPLWEVRRLAIGASTRTETLHVTLNSVSSSLYAMGERQLAADPRSSVAGDEMVDVMRLDDVPDLVQSAERILLKADVEGGELAVLEGAAAILEQTRLLELELSAVPLHEGQPLLGEVVHWCERSGFVLTGIEVSFRERRTGDLLSANGFFRRT
jgi:FkbM family methyltransferase